MNVNELRSQWERFGSADPMRAVLTDRAAYDREWTAEEFFALGRADVEARLRLIQSYGLPVERRDALDFGCGAGRLTQGLADFFERATGVDVAATMIQAAERYNLRKDRVRFVQNVAADLRIFPDCSFDLVLSHIVLQHLEPRLALGYIAEFVRVLRPGGVATFQIPTRRLSKRLRYALIQRFPSLVRAYRSRRFGLAPDMEMHMVPHERISDALARHGGRVVGVEQDQAAGPSFVSSIYIAVKRV